MVAVAEDGRRLPLSPAQVRLWELEVGDEGARGAHGFALAYTLRGPLDVPRLTAAVRAVAARHPLLRAHVAVDADAELPHFVVAASADAGPALEVRPVGEECTGDPPRVARAVLRAEASRPLDPAAGPPWRCVLFACGEDAHVLLLHFHHVIADRWSVAVFVGDLSAAYTALADGHTPFAADAGHARRAARPPATLASAAEDDTIAAAALDYWRQRFADPPPPLVLPSVGAAQAYAGYAGERVEVTVDAAVARVLREQAAAASTTLYPVLLAAFAALLRAHTGQEDLVLCTPMTGRHRAGTRGVIGYFNNVVPLRLDASGDPQFDELVGRVAGQARDAYGHQDAAFHDVAALPELAGVRLTRCLFTVQNVPGLDLQLPGVASDYEDVPGGRANFDLAVFLEDRPEGTRLLLDYKTSVLTAAVAAALAERYVAVLGEVAARPTARLSELPAYRDATAHAGAEAGAAPRDPRRATANLLEYRMVQLWREFFRQAPERVHADADFFALGGDSMQAAALFARIEGAFGRELPLATLFEAPTPRLLAERLADASWVAPWLSLVPLRTEGSRPPLFLVTGGGGHPLTFRKILDLLPADQPIYCLQAKGIRRGDIPLRSIEQMAEHFLTSVRAVRAAGPYLVAGHSLGAAVAYEMAQRLVGAGESVPFVGLFDHPGPDVRLSRGDWLRFHVYNLRALGPRERWEYVSTGLGWRLRLWRAWRLRSRRPGAPAPAQPSPLVQRLAQAMHALQVYRIAPFAGRITLFRALQGSPRILADPHGGWGRVTEGVDVVEVPGTHLTMFDEPNIYALGAALARDLERVAAGRPDAATSAAG